MVTTTPPQRGGSRVPNGTNHPPLGGCPQTTWVVWFPSPSITNILPERRKNLSSASARGRIVNHRRGRKPLACRRVGFSCIFSNPMAGIALYRRQRGARVFSISVSPCRNVSPAPAFWLTSSIMSEGIHGETMLIRGHGQANSPHPLCLQVTGNRLVALRHGFQHGRQDVVGRNCSLHSLRSHCRPLRAI